MDKMPKILRGVQINIKGYISLVYLLNFDVIKLKSKNRLILHILCLKVNTEIPFLFSPLPNIQIFISLKKN